jgi:SPP1 family predicted phage head-tail adaptor
LITGKEQNLAFKIADLRQRIKFQNLVRAPDGQGGFTESWTDFQEVWAQVVPASAKELYFAQQIRPEITHKITIRNLIGLNTSMRILFGSRVFQVKGIRNEDERLWFQFIDAVENVGS